VQPQTKYARSDDGYVAYQVVGEGPPDMVLVSDWWSAVDLMWEEPRVERVLRGLAAFGRLILFDKGGHGSSDPVPPDTSIEHFVDDVRVVLDAAGSERAAIIGEVDGGPVAMLFAASHPERSSALVLINTYARFLRDVDYEWGMPPGQVQEMLAGFERFYGTDVMLEVLEPSTSFDARFREWFGRWQRLAMAPGAATSAYRAGLYQTDLRPVLSSIQTPTLVMHRAKTPVIRVDHGRYLGRAIPGAKYVELPGDHTLYFAGDSNRIVDEIREFLTGARQPTESDRVLATVLVTDIVGSTDLAVRLGDRAWRELLDRHDALTRDHIRRARGREVKATGDGFLATFDGPARAIRCASMIAGDVQSLGIGIRTGVHTGEIEVRGDDVGGIAVHIAARISALALPGEILASRTVKDLVAGSGIKFAERGAHRLKGVPDEWLLFAVAGVD
jgi:class 3 adenylate cyclase